MSPQAGLTAFNNRTIRGGGGFQKKFSTNRCGDKKQCCEVTGKLLAMFLYIVLK